MAFKRSFTSSSSKKKEEFAAELSQLLMNATSGTTIEQSVSTHIVESSFEVSSEHYVVVKDYAAEDEDGVSLNAGDIVEAVEYAESAKKVKMDPELEIGEIGNCLDNSAARHKLSIRPRRNHVDPRARGTSRSNSGINCRRVYVRTADGKEGWVPSTVVKQSVISEESSTLTSHHRPEDSHYRREIGRDGRGIWQRSSAGCGTLFETAGSTRSASGCS